MAPSFLDVFSTDVITRIIETISIENRAASGNYYKYDCGYDKDLLNMSLVCRAFLPRSRKLGYSHITLPWTDKDPARLVQDILEILSSPHNTILANITVLRLSYFGDLPPPREQVEKHRATINAHLPQLMKALLARLEFFQFNFPMACQFDWNSSSEEFKSAFAMVCAQPSIKRLVLSQLSCPLDTVSRACRLHVEDLHLHSAELLGAGQPAHPEIEGPQAGEGAILGAAPPRDMVTEPTHLRSFDVQVVNDCHAQLWMSGESATLFASLTNLVVSVSLYGIDAHVLSSLINACASTLETLRLHVMCLPDDTFRMALKTLPALRRCGVIYALIESSGWSYKVLTDLVKSVLDSAQELESVDVFNIRKSDLSRDPEHAQVVLSEMGDVLRAFTDIRRPGPKVFDVCFSFMGSAVPEGIVTEEEFRKEYFEEFSEKVSELFGEIRKSPKATEPLQVYFNLQSSGHESPHFYVFGKLVPKVSGDGYNAVPQ